MPPKMSKTAAIQATRNAVAICKSGRTSFHVYGPYRVDEPEGPTTEMTADSWWAARILATRWRAEVALCLMGVGSEDAVLSVYQASERNGIADIGGLIDAALARCAA